MLKRYRLSSLATLVMALGCLPWGARVTFTGKIVEMTDEGTIKAMREGRGVVKK